MTNVQSFVEKWSRVWNGRDSDPDLYLELLQEDCVLVNPLSPMTRDELPQFMESVLAMEPDIRVAATQWAATADGIVFIEWINTGTVNGAPIELRGVDRFTLRDGKASEGFSYFDPRPFLEGQEASTGQ
jgi:ketosteroid isomerase-like protein